MFLSGGIFTRFGSCSDKRADQSTGRFSFSIRVKCVDLTAAHYNTSNSRSVRYRMFLFRNHPEETNHILLIVGSQFWDIPSYGHVNKEVRQVKERVGILIGLVYKEELLCGRKWIYFLKLNYTRGTKD